MLSAPALTDSYWNDDWPRRALWPQQTLLPLQSAAAVLPVPAQSVFQLPDGLRRAMLAAARRSASG